MAKVERFSSGSVPDLRKESSDITTALVRTLLCQRTANRTTIYNCKKQAVMHKCITACFIIIWRRGWDSNPRAPIKGQLDFEPFRHFFTHENINQQFKSVVLNFLDKLG